MKKLLVLCSLLVGALCLSAQQSHAVIDVQHYNFDISLSDDKDIIEGNAAIDVTFLEPSGTVTFDLAEKGSSGKGMTVSSVTVGNKAALPFTHANGKLTITLPAIAKAGDKKTFTIHYAGIPADGLIIANNKYHHRGFFADNWPNRAHNWIPCVDHPADKATVDFTVTAPSHYQVVANGKLVSEKTIEGNKKQTKYKETVILPTKIMVIGVSDFAVNQSGTVNGIPVYSWVYPEEKEKGFYDYAQATEILPYFISHVGPYAYEKLANVQSTTIFGGMENAGTIFYHENSITGTRKSEALLAHEIAHQWFGDMATETDWPHLWLSEGFATYMTILYFEHKYGQDTARKMLANNRSTVISFSKTNHTPVVDTTVTNYMDLLNANSYQKGGWVLHMLRQQLGDSTFWKGIRSYYAKFAGKNASTADFQQIMENVSGQSLQTFFLQWLYTACQPELSVTWKYDEAKKATIIHILQQQTKAFTFPLELAFVSPDGTSTVQSFRITEKESTFSIPANSKPAKLIADPAVKLLFDGIVAEVK